VAISSPSLECGMCAHSPRSPRARLTPSPQLSLLAFPSLQPAATPIHITQGEIYDATFSATQLVVATTVNLLVYALTTTASEKGKEKASTSPAAEPITASLELVRTVERAALPGSFAGSSFRAARFDPADPRTLYTLVNTVPSAAQRRTRGTPRPAFVLKWDAETWEVVKVRKVSDKSATCFETR
jgi:prolactin regulatory element-binding protein